MIPRPVTPVRTARSADRITGAPAAAACAGTAGWAELHREADARTASPALRESSRSQGRQLLRAAKAAAAGLEPVDAARAAAYAAVAGPASAAVRLLALDTAAGSAVTSGARALGSLVLVDPAWEGNAPPAIVLGPMATAVGLAGPAAQVTALAPDAPRLRVLMGGERALRPALVG